MKKLCIFILVMAPKILFAQTTEFEGTVHLTTGNKVYKMVTVPNCSTAYTPPPGTTGTTASMETKLSNDKTDIVLKDEVTLTGGGPYNIMSNKEIRVDVPNEGLASLYTDDKDKSKLYVNYLILTPINLPAGTYVVYETATYNCTGVVSMIPQPIRQLSVNESFNFRKVYLTDAIAVASDWFKNSDRIDVCNSAGAIQYYLVDQYGVNTKYMLDLVNRKYISYKSFSITLSALTIPFKYRFGFKRNGVALKDDVTANINIGAFGGYKLSKYQLVNKAGTFTNKKLYSFRVGPYFGLSTTTIDSASTTVSKDPIKDKDVKQNIMVMSGGVGGMFEFQGLQIGIFGGIDLGIGPDTSKWNYNKRFWLGIGVGYKLTDLFEQKSN